MPSRTLAFRFDNGISFEVFTADAPATREWLALCEALVEHRNELRGVIVYSEGGGPSARQRRELRDALGDRSRAHAAILTASPSARMIVTAINWFFSQEQAKAFLPTDLKGALAHLEENGVLVQRESAIVAIAELCRELGIRLPAFAS